MADTEKKTPAVRMYLLNGVHVATFLVNETTWFGLRNVCEALFGTSILPCTMLQVVRDTIRDQERDTVSSSRNPDIYKILRDQQGIRSSPGMWIVPVNTVNYLLDHLPTSLPYELVSDKYLQVVWDELIEWEHDKHTRSHARCRRRRRSPSPSPPPNRSAWVEKVPLDKGAMTYGFLFSPETTHWDVLKRPMLYSAN